MGDAQTTLSELLAYLGQFDSDDALVFQTAEGEIGSGYHVTEFKYAAITGIDCGARISSWDETLLQLLDGQGGTHMSVNKFSGIARKSAKEVAGLGEAPFYVEYAPSNSGLRRYQVAGIAAQSGRVSVTLSEDGATCKPAVEHRAGVALASNAASCCGQETAKSACCG